MSTPEPSTVLSTWNVLVNKAGQNSPQGTDILGEENILNNTINT